MKHVVCGVKHVVCGVKGASRLRVCQGATTSPCYPGIGKLSEDSMQQHEPTPTVNQSLYHTFNLPGTRTRPGRRVVQ